MSKVINIDWGKVGMMLEADCSGSEVASSLGISSNTLYQRCKKDLNCDFVTFRTQKRETGDSLLKMRQFEAAIKDRDRSMMIWLGKQRLGQSDKKEVQSKVETNITGFNYIKPDESNSKAK